MPIPAFLASLEDYQQLPDVVTFLSNAEQVYSQPPITNDTISQLRRALLHLLNNAVAIKPHSSSFFEGLYDMSYGLFGTARPNTNALGALPPAQLASLKEMLANALYEYALAYPLNTDDVIDQELIAPEDPCLYSLTGQKYRLTSLAMWIQHKKAFVYPNVNITMYAHDIEQFKALCDEHHVSYAPLNEHLRAIAEGLNTLGISMESIRQLNVPQLRINHVNALRMLIQKHGLTEATAFSELQALNYEQADAIIALYDRGLRGDHLRGLEITEEEYMPHHTAVMQWLMDDLGYDLERAVESISPYPYEEVGFLYGLLQNPGI